MRQTQITLTIVAASLGACAHSPGLPPGQTSIVQAAPAATSTRQIALFAENHDDIVEYDAGGNLIRKIKHGIPQPGNVGGLAFDSKGTLYAVTGTFAISMYAPVTRKFVGTISDGLQTPLAIAVDRRDDLYAGNEIYNDVAVYFRGRKHPSRTIGEGINDPAALAFDSRDNLYVANLAGDSVTVYSPYGKLLRTVRDGVFGPEAIALDAKDDLFVANTNYGAGATVTIYKPHSNRLAKTLQTGKQPQALAVDAADSLYVANAASGTATVYSAPNWKLSYTIRNVGNSRNIAVDASGDLYLSCYLHSKRNDARIKIYKPGANVPSKTIHKGLVNVYVIALGPP
jgi:hypothetical protein